MRREIHLIDGSIIISEKQASDVENSTTVRSEHGGRETPVDPLLSRLRSLKAKARRLGVWQNALTDTERGIISASLLLERIGKRIRIILEELSLKLKQKLRVRVLSGLQELGLEVAAKLVTFFQGPNAKADLLEDADYLIYLGFREQVSRTLRAWVQ
ncbi:MAG: hypothetical protein QW514_06935 [Thermoprotei archaeon]